MPAPSRRQLTGFALLLQPDVVVRSFEDWMRTHDAWSIYQDLVEQLKPLPRTSYRGISRSPIQPLPSADGFTYAAFENSGCDDRIEYEARLRFSQYRSQHQLDESDEDLLPDLQSAREVLSLLKQPSDYEILQLVRDSYIDKGNCLGFDVGYWGGDHFSIICDSAVCPTWHPPQPEVFAELATHLRMVNNNFLFATPGDAARFLSWYRTQNWAESVGVFHIIQVVRPT